jgi:hypothetical protein
MLPSRWQSLRRLHCDVWGHEWHVRGLSGDTESRRVGAAMMTMTLIEHLEKLGACLSDGKQFCDAHVSQGNRRKRAVALLDNSQGQFPPLRLCSECLMALVLELEDRP